MRIQISPPVHKLKVDNEGNFFILFNCIIYKSNVLCSVYLQKCTGIWGNKVKLVFNNIDIFFHLKNKKRL